MKTTAIYKDWVLAALLTVSACGGASQTSKGQLGAIAQNAAPPPVGAEAFAAAAPQAAVERSVTREAKKDFASAVVFFQEQQKKGWTSATCSNAADKFLEVASAHDKMVEAYFNAGVSYQKCGDRAQAEKQYKRALDVAPNHASSLANLGEIYYRGGNKSVGEQYFARAYNADKANVAANNNMAWVTYQKMVTLDTGSKEWKVLEGTAKGHLSRALAGDNDNIVAYTTFALVYMNGSERNRSRLAIAELLLREGDKRSQGFAPLYNAWGLLELRRRNVGTALAKFRDAVKLDPNFVEARMNVGQIVLNFRRYDEAKEHFEFVTGRGEVDKIVMYDATVALGVALRGGKKIDEAEAMYKRARDLDPGRGEAYFNLGILWKEFRPGANLQDNVTAFGEAKKYFEQSLSKSNVSAALRKEAQDNIGDCEKTIKILNDNIKAIKEAEAQASAANPGAK